MNKSTQEKIQKKDVKFGFSYFIGPMIRKDNREPLMCQICNAERAMWAHERKDGGKSVALCFGCGKH